MASKSTAAKRSRSRSAKRGPGDIVLLAGKGHEKVQVTREGSHPFDDVAVAREALRAAGFECEPDAAREAAHEADALEESRNSYPPPENFRAKTWRRPIPSTRARSVRPTFLRRQRRAARWPRLRRRGAGKGRGRGGGAQRSTSIAIPMKRCLLAVDDTLIALQTLATAVRKTLGQAAGGRHGFGGQDHDQRSDRACSGVALPRAEVRREFQ